VALRSVVNDGTGSKTRQYKGEIILERFKIFTHTTNAKSVRS